MARVCKEASFEDSLRSLLFLTGGGSFTVAGSAVYRGSGFKEILGFVCLLTSILGDGERMFGHGENTHCSEPV